MQVRSFGNLNNGTDGRNKNCRYYKNQDRVTLK